MELDKSTKEQRNQFNSSMLNILSYLETNDEITAIDFKCYGTNTINDISNWERKNMPYKLPNDLKAFYMLYNGFTIKYKLTMNQLLNTVGGNSHNDIGYVNCNKLDMITRVGLDGIFINNTASTYNTMDISGSA